MKKSRWVEGKQRSSYKRLRVFSCKFILGFDCHLLKVEEGGAVNTHLDTMRMKWKNRKALRINFIWPPKMGGQFYVEKAIFQSRYLYIFRPDIYKHGVTKVEKGTRFVLSFGISW